MDHLKPRVVHFIFGLQPQVEPFHLLHYLAIASCRQVLQPDEIRLHIHQLPYGVYWDLVRPLVTLARIAPVPEVAAHPATAEIERYRYAHHADVVRLDVLALDGGMYADIDTLFIRPVPEYFWEAEALIGAEAPVLYADSTEPEDSLTNALMMAQPDARFITTWRERILDAFDGSWSAHSNRLATRIAAEVPESVQVVVQPCFSPFAHTIDGMRSLLEAPLVPKVLAETYSVHLCAHLWWARDRIDFSQVSAGDVTERFLRESDTTLAHLARPFLPSHGRF